MGERVLDIEVVGVVENRHDIAVVGAIGGTGFSALGGDGNGVERNGGGSVFCDGGHDVVVKSGEDGGDEFRRMR